MYGADQRQALVWPTLASPVVEDDCGPGRFSIFRHLFLLFSFVQYAVYDHVLSNHANII